MAPKDLGKISKQQMGQENQYASDFSGRGGSAWNSLFPALNNQITNPTGYTPQEKAEIRTAERQGLGGSTSAISGRGSLLAGRTNNPAAMGAVLDEAARGAQRAEAQGDLNIEEKSANLAQQKQQDAMRTLGSLYGVNVQGLNDMLGQANKSLDEYSKASSGLDTAMGVLGTVGNLGMKAAGMAMNPAGVTTSV